MKMLNPIFDSQFRSFFSLEIQISSRGRGLAETCIVSLTSGDILLGMGFGVGLKCYDRRCILRKVTCGDLACSKLHRMRA
jgi:hypothetical protein